MQRPDPALATFPVDEYDRELVHAVRPPHWTNPEPARKYNLVVIGAGPAGLVAARGAAALGAKVALVERNLIGGDCLNVGCVPSKALIRTSRLLADLGAARHFGVPADDRPDASFTLAMARMRRLRHHIGRGDSAARLTEEGIDVFLGEAAFAGPDRVTVAGTGAVAELRFAKALIATGSRAAAPDAKLEGCGYLTNETAFNLTRRPERLLVIGGGPLGCELAQAFCRLGAQVILAQDDPMFLSGEERDAAQILSDALARDGVEIHLATRVTEVRRDGDRKLATLMSDDQRIDVDVDEVLLGAGRVPNVEGLGLEAAGVETVSEEGEPPRIRVDARLRTANRRIYAAGDVCMQRKFTHVAEATARIAVRNALFHGRARHDRLVIPWCTYTDPEIAHVGLYVAQAREKGIPVRTFTVLMHDVDRAVTDGEENGFVKIHVAQATDRILGATVVASHAGEMINGISLAIGSGMGLKALAQVIHAYPTQAQAIRMAADAHERGRLTAAKQRLAARWMAWARR